MGDSGVRQHTRMSLPEQCYVVSDKTLRARYVVSDKTLRALLHEQDTIPIKKALQNRIVGHSHRHFIMHMARRWQHLRLFSTIKTLLWLWWGGVCDEAVAPSFTSRLVEREAWC